MDEEAAYLERYPDVLGAMQAGTIASGLDHYLRYGRGEGRRWLAGGRASAPPAPRVVKSPAAVLRVEVARTCEVALIAHRFVFVCGWVDDRRDRLTAIEVSLDDDRSAFRGPFGRYRREDVEAHVGAAGAMEAGLWSLMEIPGLEPGRLPRFSLRFTSGQAADFAPAEIEQRSIREIFAAFLAFYGQRRVVGNATARSFAELENGLASVIGRLHGATRATYASFSDGSYGVQTRPAVSFVCCIHGIPDFLFLQIALFARQGSLERFEFVYVNNSPELEDVLHRDAEIAAYLFATSVRIVSLNQNTGFSHASNIGIGHARGDMVVVINPDVFPADAVSLTGLLVMSGQRRRHRLIGAKLFYADGSVMHEGMYFTADPRLSALAGVGVWTVEHRRKGFPDHHDRTPLVVPAVSGALMVAGRREWETIGGFDEDFVYGHYEDADLCLRFADNGGKVVYEPRLAFWHYEGMGSIQRPEQAGAAYHNRWLFSRRWSSRLALRGGAEG